MTDSGVTSWRDALLTYTKPEVLSLVFLGFSAGLPYLLVFSTLTAWLRDESVSRSAIGFFAWVGMIYSIKVIWAPIVDNLRLPKLHQALGRRRSWMLLAQFGIVAALVMMSWAGPERLVLLSALAVIVAFSSATQDIAIDAYRIEASAVEHQAALSAAYILGYRVALLVSGAGALYAAEYFGWAASYQIMAAFGCVGVLTTLIIRRPVAEKNDRLEAAMGNEQRPVRRSALLPRLFIDPVVDFFERNGRFALFLLTLIAVYRLSDITMGIMANPFYLDMGYTKVEIANIAKGLGFGLSLLGSFLGGLFVVRFGLLRTLLLGAILVALTNLTFAGLALSGPDLMLLALVIGLDNLSGGIAATSFIAYLSSLTDTRYTATQYALFSSLMTLPGKFTSGFSGLVVDGFGYSSFFIGAACLGIPAVVMVVVLIRRQLRDI
ncbi:MAG: AmpG family muropeptide MFS transporter [Pseudomonadales bacterium]